MQTEKPYFYFTDNPLDRHAPILNLELYHQGEGTYYQYELSFQEAFLFAAALSREIAARVLEHPRMRHKAEIREVGVKPEGSTNSYKPLWGALHRFMTRE